MWVRMCGSVCKREGGSESVVRSLLGCGNTTEGIPGSAKGCDEVLGVVEDV